MLFNKAARENEASVLALTRGGFLSDPVDFSMYVFVKVGEYGRMIWRCVPTEGLHAKLIRWLSAFNADPELLDGYLATFRQRHNSDVSSPDALFTLTDCLLSSGRLPQPLRRALVPPLRPSPHE